MECRLILAGPCRHITNNNSSRFFARCFFGDFCLILVGLGARDPWA